MANAKTNHADIVLSCRGVSHGFGKNHVLHNINLDIARGQVVALVGPSGCGKSTLFRAITGTHPAQSGQVIIRSNHNHANEEVVVTPTRKIGIVYQEYTLFPHLTALENVLLGLKIDRTTIPFRTFRYFEWRKLRRSYLTEAEAILEKFGLAEAVHRYPSELSGGQRQRVAIAQALVMKPEILLLDEPFGALDESTRNDLQQMVLGLYEDNCRAIAAGKSPEYTVLMVTHELSEALFVSNRVLGLSQYYNWREEGHPQFPGATIVYDRPAPVFKVHEVKDQGRLQSQLKELSYVVFDSDHTPVLGEFVTFWDQVNAGEIPPVLAP